MAESLGVGVVTMAISDGNHSYGPMDKVAMNCLSGGLLFVVDMIRYDYEKRLTHFGTYYNNTIFGRKKW